MSLENKKQLIEDISEQIDSKTDEYNVHYSIPTKLILESYAQEVKILIENIINKY